MTMKLIWRPRALRRMTTSIRNEVRASWKLSAAAAVRTLEEDIADWDEKPRFITKVVVSKKKWLMRISVDRRTKIGKIYMWVDEGTGLWGPKKAEYPILPVHAKALAFPVPYFPKTKRGTTVRPTSPVVDYTGVNLEQHDVVVGGVMHPGITPRNFTDSLRKFMRDPTLVGGLKSITEAAVKRGFRKA